MSLIVSYNVSSPSLCGVCWRVESLVETGVEWVWCLRVGRHCVYMQYYFVNSSRLV